MFFNRYFFIFCLIILFFLKNLNPEIMEVNFTVEGMVCTACVSTIKNALKGIVSVKNIDLSTGFIDATLENGDTLKINQLELKLKKAIQKGSYKFKNFKNIKAIGNLKQDKSGYFFLISKSNERVSFASLSKTAIRSFGNLLNSTLILSSAVQKNKKGVVLISDFSFEKIS